MKKQSLAVLILLVGLVGFTLIQKENIAQALSPQFSALPLYGRVIGVDAGHGGYDGGCVGFSGIPEKTFNLQIAMRVGKVLEEKGAVVVYSRTTDEALIDPVRTTGYKKRKELDNRLKIFSDNGIECMVSIHMNKFSQESQRGAQVFFDREQEEGEALAQALEQRLFALDPDYARQPSAGDYYILNACSASALVECGFLSNREEERLLAEESYQQRLAQAIACGVEDYFTNRIERRP